MSATRKPVIVRKFTREWYAGYASAAPAKEIAGLELLDHAGRLQLISWNTIKWICYVRESVSPAGSDSANPERLLRRRFTSRPRSAGLWLRITLIDGDELEGLAANDRTLVAGTGLMLTPPDIRSNTQRVFIPLQSIRELEVLAVIPAPGKGRVLSANQHSLQPGLFPGDPVADL